MTKLEELRKKAMALPEAPGVYIMKNARSEIIYIGKAKVLKNRVSQYFGSQNNHTEKVRQMVAHVDDFDYVIVGSEFEALVLECSLIKQNKPKYNILLKDDKGYHYVKVTNDSWKMLYDVKQKEDDGAKYIGPYTGGEAISAAVKQAYDIFMLPHCAKVFPRDIDRSSRPCLNYYIKLGVRRGPRSCLHGAVYLRTALQAHPHPCPGRNHPVRTGARENIPPVAQAGAVLRPQNALIFGVT